MIVLLSKRVVISTLLMYHGRHENLACSGIHEIIVDGYMLFLLVVYMYAFLRFGSNLVIL